MEKKCLKDYYQELVVSSNTNKTIVVEVTRRVKHKLYKKIIKRAKKYHAHDENNSFKKGDIVNN